MLRRSKLEHPTTPEHWDVLLVDTVGELRWWWGLGEFALVGGSFGKRGGQNMLEPAGYGCNVAFGPNTSNFRDIVDLLLAENAATRLGDDASILPWLEHALEHPEEGVARGRRAQELIMKHRGALERTVEALLALM